MPRPPSSPSPPPGYFPFTSGSFDFPHASASPPPASRPRSTRDELFSFYRARQQERGSRAMNDNDDDDDNDTVPQRLPRMDPLRRRQLRRTFASEREASELPSASSLLARRPPLTSTNRPRATPSERYLRRSQARLREQRAADMDSTTDILDSLSDLPLTNPFTMSNPLTRPRSPTSELDGQRRQTKRRKLDHHGNSASEYDGFKYGYRGQVVPGRLRMEISSCDGGEYEKTNPTRLYKVQNVLNNDKSVYCSESSSCNLLLKHTGCMPFALDKVVIRAPDRGFTAPVQEGLIFVSMSPDELLAGTAAYQIQYCPHSPGLSPSPESLGEEQLSLREAIEDPQIWQRAQQMQVDMEERIERLRLRSRRPQMDPSASSIRARREERRTIDDEDDEDDDDVYGEHCDYTAEAAGVSAPTPPPFTVTAETEVESEENEELPSPAIMADRLRRESRWRPDSDDEEDELLTRLAPPRRAFPLDSYDSYGERRWRNERYLEPIRASRLGAPSRIEPTDDTPESEGLIAPHARFFIAKHKNKITIKFNPAVSGKYVLLKLWSPTHDGNIDIESVQLYGFSGPRFFPAMQPR